MVLEGSCLHKTEQELEQTYYKGTEQWQQCRACWQQLCLSLMWKVHSYGVRDCAMSGATQRANPRTCQYFAEGASSSLKSQKNNRICVNISHYALLELMALAGVRFQGHSSPKSYFESE